MRDKTTTNYELRQSWANTIQWRRYVVTTATNTACEAVMALHPDMHAPEVATIPVVPNEQSTQPSTVITQTVAVDERRQQHEVYVNATMEDLARERINQAFEETPREPIA